MARSKRLIVAFITNALICQACMAAAPAPATPAPATKPAATSTPAPATKPAAAAAAAPKTPAPKSTTNNAGGGGGLGAPDLSAFRAILQASGVGDLGDGVATVFAPTNAAVAAGLARLGLTAADVQTKPHLADAIVGAHLVTGYSLAPGDILAQAANFPDGRVPVYTRSVPDFVVVASGTGSDSSSKGPITVTGQRGVVGRVLRVVRERKHTVIVIDALVSPGSVFGSLDDLFAYTGAPLAAARAALLASGRFTPATLQARGAAAPGAFTGTLFLPRTFAFAAAGLAKPQPAAQPQQQQEGVQQAPASQLQLSAQEARRLVDYWTLKTRRAIPDDFVSGAQVATLLPGQALSVVYDTKPGASERDFVIDQAGAAQNITRANVFIGGAGVVHVVGGVPLPSSATAAATPSAAATKKSVPKRRRLLQTPAPLPAWVADTQAQSQSVVDVSGAATAANAVAEDDAAKAVNDDARKAMARMSPDKAAPRKALPAWARPSIDTGKNLDTQDSSTLNQLDSVDQINTQVQQYDDSACC